jgi:hypothetical protein
VWRVAFAFDHKRKAILPVAGDKDGQSERVLYRRLIAVAINGLMLTLSASGRLIIRSGMRWIAGIDTLTYDGRSAGISSIIIHAAVLVAAHQVPSA